MWQSWDKASSFSDERATKYGLPKAESAGRGGKQEVDPRACEMFVGGSWVQNVMQSLRQELRAHSDIFMAKESNAAAL